MPTAREKVAACVIGQDIYVLGGAVGENQPGLQTSQRYAVPSDTWSDTSPMPTGRRSLTASVVEDVCYAIGGSSQRPAAGVHHG